MQADIGVTEMCTQYSMRKGVVPMLEAISSADVAERAMSARACEVTRGQQWVDAWYTLLQFQLIYEVYYMFDDTV